MIELIKQKQLPSWFSYPDCFIETINQNLLDFTPWIVMQGDCLEQKYQGIKQRYPNRDLVPFAKRIDNDDVACWESKKGKKIVIIHDFASSGWENVTEYDTFWDWLREVIEDMIEYHNDYLCEVTNNEK